LFKHPNSLTTLSWEKCQHLATGENIEKCQKFNKVGIGELPNQSLFFSAEQGAPGSNECHYWLL
jgi:hypothetical protein